jgi:YidC/Oxa1 family membrane protein insertase
MDRRTLLAIILCFGIFLAWQKLYIEPRMPKQVPTTAQTQSPPTESTNATTGSSAQQQPTAQTHAAASQTKKPAQTETMISGTGEATLSDSGKWIRNWNLKEYYRGLSVDTGAVDVNAVTNQAEQIELAFDDPALAYLTNVQGEFKKTADGIVWIYEDANVKMERHFTATPSQNYLGVDVNLQFKTQHPRYTFIGLSGMKLAEKDPEERDRQLLYFTNDSIERLPLAKEIPLREVGTAVKFIGVQSRYFLFSLVNNSPIEAKALIQPTSAGAGRVNLVYPITSNSISIPLKAYFGPKALPILRSVDPTLDHTVDFGWFTPIAYPLLSILRWFYQFVRNYGVAIILLTVLLKLVTYPLTYKSMKSMKQMARLQPELQKLRDKHADDKEAQNRAVLEFMRGNGYNPAAGCLPMLIQMPIFFALYRVLYSSIELYHAPFMFWIKDLSAHDPFYVTPVLMSVTMFLQQKLSPSTATDPVQQKMMMMMPLIFGAFMLSLPSGLTLYMLVNALVSIIQQLIMNKKLNIGHGTAVAASSR